jgi:flagellar biosynthesis protein FlhB
MSEEKREEATPKAERRARERGRAWQSRDLTLAAVLGLSALTIRLAGDAVTPRLLAIVRAPFVAIEAGDAPGVALTAIVAQGALLLAPLLAGIVIFGALATVVQVGPLFAPRAVEADPSRLDPSARLPELFGRRAMATLAMTLARLLLSVAAVLITLMEALPGIATLSRQVPAAALDACVSLVVALLLRVALVMAALGIVDAVLERTLYRRSLRMSRREVERERRESEGDAHVARERERVRSEIREHDADVSVPGARLVVGDGELAIALSYDRGDVEAVPRVVALGRGLLADHILALAREHGVRHVVDEALTASLAVVPLGQLIPEALYEPVARELRVTEDAAA